MISLPYLFGIIGVVVGPWLLLARPREGALDYYLSAIPGVLFILAITMFVKWFADPSVAMASKAMGPVMAEKYLHDVLNLNYVVLGILSGMVVANVFGVPAATAADRAVSP